MEIEVQFFGQLIDKTGKSSIQLEHTESLVQLKAILVLVKQLFLKI